MSKQFLSVLFALLALLLAACGGSSASAPPTSTPGGPTPIAFEKVSGRVPPNFTQVLENVPKGARIQVRYGADDVVRLRILDAVNFPVLELPRAIFGEGSVVAAAAGRYTIVIDVRFAPGNGLGVDLGYRVVPPGAGP